MPIYKGSNKIADLYYHGVAVAEIYKGNILVWTKAAAEYFVTITQAANGTITAAPMQGPGGTLVTLSNSPNTGYQLTYYTVNGNQIQGNTFTLDSDSTISGLFTAITYTVTIGSHTNGSLTANPMSGTYNTTVTLTGTPNTHYELDYYSVNGSRITGNTFSLTQNSTVAATFKKKTYTVTIGAHTNGSLSASPASGVYGTTVTLTGNPNSGYALDYFTVNGSRITGNTFTLSGNTTVTAVYKAASTPVIWLTRFDSWTYGSGVSKIYDPNGINLGDSNQSSHIELLNNHIATLTASDISGVMPATYVGTKYQKLQGTNMGWNIGQSAAIPTTYSKFTVAFWARNKATYSTFNADYSSAYPCNISAGLASSNNIYVRSSYRKSFDAGFAEGTSNWAGYYQLSNSTSYDSTSNKKWYTVPCGVGKVWHYVQIVVDRDDLSLKTGNTQLYGSCTIYVNGKKYLKITPSTAYIKPTSNSSPYNASNSQGLYRQCLRMYPNNAAANDASHCDICELVVYPGEYLTIPTAPITPA